MPAGSAGWTGSRPHPDNPDHFPTPSDWHADDGIVAKIELSGAGEIGVPPADHGRASPKHLAREPDSARHLGARLGGWHPVGGGRTHEVAVGIDQPDGAVVGADHLTRVMQNALEQRLELQLATDRFDDAAETLLLAQEALEARGG